jgi:cytidylate kinase
MLKWEVLPMVTISRQAGTEGDEITRLLAEALGWRILDNSRMEQLLVGKGFTQAVVETFNERKPDLWHRLSSGKERYLHYLKLTSYEFARQADCIILGRGGQLMFAEVPGVLKVRVVAPLEDRIRRLSAESGKDMHRALQLVQHADNERTGFHRFLFHAEWDSPDLYDLVINSHALSARAAADVILKTLAFKEVRDRRKEALLKLEQLYQIQKAFVSILFEQNLPVHYLEIEVHNGTVTLKGVARDHPSIERCREAAALVFGKKRIDNEICFEPRYVEVLSGMHRDPGGKAG